MKRSGISILFFLVTTTLFAQTRFAVEVTKISDGDTFWAINEKGENVKFRPIGFDCPEESNFGKPAQPFNKEATAYLAELIKDETVYVEYDVDPRDQWGRHLVYVYLEDGRMVNVEMLKAGWAELMTISPNVKYVELFKNAYRDAREGRRGMWAYTVSN